MGFSGFVFIWLVGFLQTKQWRMINVFGFQKQGVWFRVRAKGCPLSTSHNAKAIGTEVPRDLGVMNILCGHRDVTARPQWRISEVLDRSCIAFYIFSLIFLKGTMSHYNAISKIKSLKKPKTTNPTSIQLKVLQQFIIDDKTFQTLYVPLRYKKSLPFKSGFCLHKPPGLVPFCHLPRWHLLHEGSCSCVWTQQSLQEKQSQLQWELLPGKDSCCFIFQEPGVGLIPGRIPQPSAGTHQGWLSDPVYQAVHSHSRVCLFKHGVQECKASESNLFCKCCVSHLWLFSLMQQRNNGPLLRFLFSGMLGSLCLIFCFWFFVN